MVRSGQRHPMVSVSQVVLLLLWLPVRASGFAMRSKESQQSGQAVGNPLLEIYRRNTLAYERDAREAQEAAQKYAMMAQAVGQGGAAVQQVVYKEMQRLQVKPWANAVWQFEHMLQDKRPEQAFKVAAQARVPYEKAYKEFEKRQQSYDAAAQRYAERVNSDAELAKDLATYSNQYSLEGNTKKAAAFRQQAETLMQQVMKERKLAQEDHKMAGRIHSALAKVQEMSKAAGDYAAYESNPAGGVPASHLFPFTVAPPLAPDRDHPEQ